MEYPLDNKIIGLSNKGFTEDMIAKKLDVPTGTVEIILYRLGWYVRY